MNKAKESNKGSFLDEGFHGTKALVGSLAYFNFGTESESLNLDYLFVCRLSPNMVALLFYKIAASCELSPGCGAEVPGGVHSL